MRGDGCWKGTPNCENTEKMYDLKLRTVLCKGISSFESRLLLTHSSTHQIFYYFTFTLPLYFDAKSNMFSTTTTTILFGLAALGFASAAPMEARATYDGMATYYYQGGNAGSCGDAHAGE
jgi:hypothetical protein